MPGLKSTKAALAERGKIARQKLQAKAATTGAGLPKLAEGLDKIVDQVASRLVVGSSTVAPKLVEGVDKLAELVAAKLAQQGNKAAEKMAQQMLAEKVDKIAELVAEKLGAGAGGGTAWNGRFFWQS